MERREWTVARIDRYMLAKTVLPLGATVAVAALLLLLERMLRLFDFVINENGPAEVVSQMLAHLVPHYLGLALPLGLFLGTALAFRGLSLSSELDALMASGAGMFRLTRPIFLLALALVAFDVWLVGFQQPESRYAYRQLSFELRSGALGASIGVGDFVSLTEDITLRVGGSRNDGQELTDIFLRRAPTAGETITATAERGAFFSTGDEQTVLLRLFDGRLVEFEPDRAKPRVLSFQSHDIVVDLPEVEAERPSRGMEREMSLIELGREIAAGNTGPPGNAEAYGFLGEFHWRLVHILTLLAIPLSAAPLGVADKRTGSAGGLLAGLTLLIVYSKVLEAGERQIASDGTAPLLGVWSVFAAYGAIGLALFLSSGLRPGRGAAGTVDRIANALLWPLRQALALLRRSLR